MHELTVGIEKLLKADLTLTTKLKMYRSHPAIFASAAPPDFLESPYVVIRGAAADTPWDSHDTPGNDVVQDIAVYARDLGSPRDVSVIAKRVRKLLHRCENRIEVAGYSVVQVIASGPIEAPEEIEYLGRVVTIRATLQEDG